MHSHDRTLLAKLGFSDADKKEQSHDWACQYIAQPEVLTRLFTSLLQKNNEAESVLVADSRVETHIVKGEGQYRTTIGFADVTARVELRFERKVTLHPPCPQPHRVGHQTEWPDDPEWIAGEKAVEAWNCANPRPPQCHAEPSAAKSKHWYEISDKEQKPLFNALSKAADSAKKRAEKRYEQAYVQALADWHEATRGETSDKIIISSAADLLVEVKINQVTAGDAIRQLKLYREYLPVNLNQSNRDKGVIVCASDCSCIVCSPNSYYEGVECKRCKNPHCPRPAWSEFLKARWDQQESALRRISTLLVTAYPLDTGDVATLAKEGILHVKLGPAFEEFAAKRLQATPATNVEI